MDNNGNLAVCPDEDDLAEMVALLGSLACRHPIFFFNCIQN